MAIVLLDGTILSMAERVGFEPTVEFPRHSLSRRAPSTARTPLRSCSLILRESRRRGNACQSLKLDRSGRNPRAPCPVSPRLSKGATKKQERKSTSSAPQVKRQEGRD